MDTAELLLDAAPKPNLPRFEPLEWVDAEVQVILDSATIELTKELSETLVLYLLGLLRVYVPSAIARLRVPAFGYRRDAILSQVCWHFLRRLPGLLNDGWSATRVRAYYFRRTLSIARSVIESEFATVKGAQVVRKSRKRGEKLPHPRVEFIEGGVGRAILPHRHWRRDPRFRAAVESLHSLAMALAPDELDHVIADVHAGVPLKNAVHREHERRRVLPLQRSADLIHGELLAVGQLVERYADSESWDIYWQSSGWRPPEPNAEPPSGLLLAAAARARRRLLRLE